MSKADKGNSIRVCCRVRPLNARELAEGAAALCVDVPKDKDGVIVHRQSGAENVRGLADVSTTFTFDKVFPLTVKQKTVYEYAALPTVLSVMEGFNGTVFAYGQTSSGKTHTMQGPDIHDPDLQGVIPRMVWTIFDAIYGAPPTHEYLVKVSMVELYMERVRCLLDPTGKENLKIKERPDKGIYIEDVTESYVQSEQEIFDALQQAQYNRTIGATAMNAQSSRSHMVFLVSIESKDTVKKVVKHGKLYLVDLAGSEKIAKTHATAGRLEEAKMINKSLSALGNVINALTEPNKTHVPYRDSKLTRLLSESLGGNAKTTLIITCSPANTNDAETLSTLRFGQRAKLIKNNAVANESLSVEALQAQVATLKGTLGGVRGRVKQLEALLNAKGIPVPAADDSFQCGDGDADDGGHSPRATGMSAASQGEIDDLQKENGELRNDMEAAQKAEQAAKEQLQQVAAEKEQSKYEKDELAAKVHSIQAELATQKAEVESLRLEKKNLKEEVVDAKAQARAEKAKGIAAIAKKVKGQSASTVVSIAARELLSDDETLDENSKMILAVVKDLAESQVKMARENEFARADSSKLAAGAGELEGLLREKDAAVTKLEVDIANERERVADLQEKLKDGDRPLKRKVSQLDKNLEQLTVMYHKLVSQNSGLKVECQVNEKKVIRKDQRITSLETSLREAKGKYEKLLTQCANLTAAMDLMGKKENRTTLGAGKARLMRPLQGGQQAPRRVTASKAGDDEQDEAKDAE
ncbi:unnamed protein product [Amoebophrya sp. A25]|nr:unnamed protein product [Amoebophrya sp. A25]|eukprot:GSA25T00016714001.1